MKTILMAARRAAMFTHALLIFSLLLFPAIGQSASKATQFIEKSGPIEKTGPTENSGLVVGPSLQSTGDFIEYAEEHEVDIHYLYFDLRPYEGTKTCLMCHEEEGTEMLDSAHFKWEGKVDNIVGLEGKTHGKNDLINNFCIAVATNEGRCTQCHAGYGYKDANYDFEDPLNIDCLACHDQSGTYKKAPKTAGLPDPSVDLQAVASSIRIGSVMRCVVMAKGLEPESGRDRARRYNPNMGPRVIRR